MLNQMLICNELQYKENYCNEKYDFYHISKMHRKQVILLLFIYLKRILNGSNDNARLCY